ncbi:3-oxoacyl-ACP reductase [Pseudomonas sp. RIT-PI-S]|uniref:3-oxoacyl-ACP reductase n=1 Tax=Pseudomonas sp. RIT-PI-S TaxID=3035295 RepID=UPI0021DB4655|nr:3-oxoacyl-ACP reductase [Pseudomonas sp. RIT-PI-S]
MADPYVRFANSELGRRIVGAVGLPSPARLERWHSQRQREVEGALLVGGGPLAIDVAGWAAGFAEAVYSVPPLDPATPAWSQDQGQRPKAVVYDASALRTPAELQQLMAFFQPLLRALEPCARVVILGTAEEALSDPIARVTQRALEGFSRSLAKELRDGGTAQLLYVAEGAKDQVEGALRFLLSPKSAYVSGQVLTLRPAAVHTTQWPRPLEGQRALVTGAARGIGAAIAETLARDGAKVVLLDVPQAHAELAALAARLGASALNLDITSSEAASELLAALPEGVDIVVHNAGITRDKTLANMTPEFWDPVIAVNLEAPLRLTQALIEHKALGPAPRIVLLSSVTGIAGNRGQANYAAAKAGLIGFAEAMAEPLAAQGGSIVTVAPGFIETNMTDRMPFALREAGRRMSALGQGGQPQDVAEAVAWLAQPGAAALNGQVLRVCGQSFMGA